jgi:predicted nucleic acid-binding Zn ribbon protein
MINPNKIEVMVDILMEHQKECGNLIRKDGDDENIVTCDKCGARIRKEGNRAVIDTKEFTIGLL